MDKINKDTQKDGLFLALLFCFSLVFSGIFLLGVPIFICLSFDKSNLLIFLLLGSGFALLSIISAFILYRAFVRRPAEKRDYEEASGFLYYK